MMRVELESPFTSFGIGASVPIGMSGLVHVWGRNDMTTTQRMGIGWTVTDPDGVIVEEYGIWEAWPYTGPGVEHEFIGGRFDINKVGDYMIAIELRMNYDDPVVVDDYVGLLCRVTEEYAGIISKLELEYDSDRAAIPASDILQGKSGLVHIWGRNDMSTSQKLGISWTVKDPDGVVVEEYSDWQTFSTGPGDEHEFIGGRFDLDKVGTYTLVAGLLMSPDAPVYVDTYTGVLCTVAAEVFAGTIIKKELEYDSVRGDIPVY